MSRRKLYRISTVLVLAGGLLGAGSAGADTAHQHQITTGNGETHLVAPGLCNAGSEQAGDNFHQNVDVGGPDASSGAPAISITTAGPCDSVPPL